MYVFDSSLSSLLEGPVMGNLEPVNVNVGYSGIVKPCTPMVLNLPSEISLLIANIVSNYGSMSEAFPVHYSWATFVILLFGDPHLLESGQRT